MILVKNGKKKSSFKVFCRSVILYLAKLQYFTNLDLPEISGFPSSATNLEGRVRSQVVQDSSIHSRTHVMVYLSYILVHIYDPNSGEYRLQPKFICSMHSHLEDRQFLGIQPQMLRKHVLHVSS